MKYNPKIVAAFFRCSGVPEPRFELRFCPPRRWKFDLAWADHKLALEVQGGIFVRGRHNRGAAMLKEWEKLNAAAVLGWRVLFCQPKDLCMNDTVEIIKRALEA